MNGGNERESHRGDNSTEERDGEDRKHLSERKSSSRSRRDTETSSVSNAEAATKEEEEQKKDETISADGEREVHSSPER